MSLTEEQVLKIPELVREGMSSTEIAKKYQCSGATIRRWMKNLRAAGHDVPVCRPGPRPIKLT